MTIRVHISEKHDVYCGRGSEWGNPFTHIKNRPTKAQYVVATRKEAIDKYREYLLSNNELMTSIKTLRGKRLACYCKDNQYCHVDVIIEVLEEKKYHSLF